MPSTKEFVYQLGVEYDGGQAMRQLTADLERLRKMRMYDRAQSGLDDLLRGLDDARRKAREMEQAWRKDGTAEARRRYQAAAAEVRRLSTAVDRQQASLRQQRTALAASGVQVHRLGQAMKETERAAREQGQAMARYARLGLRPVAEIEQEIRGLERAYRDLERSGVASAKDLERAKRRLREETARLRREMDGQATGAPRLSSSLKALAAAYLGVQAAQAAVRGMVQVQGEFAAFDDAIRAAGAVSRASAEEIDQLRQAAEEMGETTRYSSTEAANALKFLGMSGMSASDSIEALPVVLDMASAGAMDIAEAADIATNVLTGYGLQVADLTMVSDRMVAVTTRSNTDIRALGEAFSYAGPIALAAGQDFDETAAILGALAQAGYRGERAGTALRGAMSRLLRPNRQVIATLERLGVSVGTAEGGLRPMVDILDDLKRSGATASDIVRIFGQEAGPGMATLLQAGTESIITLRDEIRAADGEASRVSSSLEAGIGGALRSLSSAWDAVKKSMGQAVAEEWSGTIGDLTALLREHKDELAGWASDLAALAKLVARMGMGLGELVADHRGLIKVLGTVTALWYGYRKAVLAVEVANKLLAGGQVVTSLASIGTAARGAAAGLWAMNASLAPVLAGLAALAAGYKAGEWIAMRKEMQGIARATRDLEKGTARLDARFREISQATGVTVTSMEELDRAVERGKIVYDEAAGEWVAAARDMEQAERRVAQASADTAKAQEEFRQAVAQASQEAARWAQAYAQEAKAAAREAAQEQVARAREALSAVKAQYDGARQAAERYRAEVASRSAGMDATLRDMARQGMGAAEAWQDMKAQAEEYLRAARQAAQAGDQDRAKELADQAAAAYRNLRGEVREGDQVVVSSQEALQAAMEGYRAAASLALDVAREQQREAEAAEDRYRAEMEAATARLRRYEDDLKRLTTTTVDEMRQVEESVKAIQEQWAAAWEDAADQGGAAIDEMMADTRRLIELLKQARLGGGGSSAGTATVPGYASGGRVPGPYERRDSVLSWLAPGEGVLPSDAMRAWDLRLGRGFFDRILMRPHGPEARDLVARITMPRAPAAPAAVAAVPAGGYSRPLRLPDIYGGVEVLAREADIPAIMRALERARRVRSRLGSGAGGRHG